MKEPIEKPVVKLIDTDGNAFAIIGHVKSALLKASADKEYVTQYMNQAMSGLGLN